MPERSVFVQHLRRPNGTHQPLWRRSIRRPNQDDAGTTGRTGGTSIVSTKTHNIIVTLNCDDVNANDDDDDDDHVVVVCRT